MGRSSRCAGVTKRAPPAGRSILAGVDPFLDRAEADVKLGEIVDAIEAQDGLGPVLFVLTLPVLLPVPPGVSMVMALPLLIVAPQIMIGRRQVWIPQWLRARHMKREELAKVVHRVRPAVAKAEARVRPRLQFLTSRLGICVVGAVCSVLALVLVLPIPFANLAPSLALSAFAIGLWRRDGAFVLAAYGLVVLAAAVIVAGAHGAVVGLAHLRALFH